MKKALSDQILEQDDVISAYLQPQLDNGIGTFQHINGSMECEFVLKRMPHMMCFELKGKPVSENTKLLFNLGDEWKIDGKLQDGRPIKCLRLLHTNITFGSEGNVAIFIPGAALKIGAMRRNPPQSVMYRLIGYHEGEFEIVQDGWTVKTIGDGLNEKQAHSLRRGWHLPSEGLSLQLSIEQARLKDYENTARQVIQLLSLACGNGITYNRCTAFWDDEHHLETFGQGAGDEFGPGPCVPSFCIKSFLEQVLPVYRSWPQEKRELFKLVVTNINESNNGYLDTRLLQIMQGWETLATAWIPESPFTEEELILKKTILRNCKSWRKTYPKSDSEGQYSNRLASLFLWPRLRRRIECLALSREIDLQKIKLDVYKLKEARDKVVHSGLLPDYMIKDRSATVKLLDAAQFGLQLVLLSELGYSGLVETEKNGWKAHVQISELLK